jgi:N6-adenosine-specific RNA methylase IME4
MNELTTIDNYCLLDKTSLSFKREITKDEWMYVFKSLKVVEGCVQFWLGDCLAYRQQKWGMYDDIAEETGYEKETLRQYKKVAEMVESGVRTPNLGWSHHKQVAVLPPDRQEVYLKKAIDENLSVRELRQEVRNDKHHFRDNPLPSNKYRVFYADPPWKYTSGDQHSTEEQDTVLGTHYPSMTIAELCALDIKSISQNDAVLFLWVTSPLLEESFDVINAWGFQYKTSMVWDKVKHNVGHYVSNRHEFVLICTKGSCKPDNPKLYDSVVSKERTEHSRKPQEFRRIIDDLYPLGARIELFAREKVENWEYYGNDPIL